MVLELPITPQQLKFNPRVTWLDESRLGTHGCSWATWIPSFTGRTGRGKSAKTAEKDSSGHICSQLHAKTSTSRQREPWQLLWSPVYTWPGDLQLTPCVSKPQPREITRWSSLAQEHRSGISSSLGKLPVSKFFSVLIVAELLKSARGPRQTSSKRFTFSWIWRARPHPRMCSRSPRCRNQINTLMPWIPSPIWEEEAKRPFLEFTKDYQTTTNLDWRWLSQRGGPGRSAAALQGRKGRGLWGTSTLPARGSGSGSWCALLERSWTACRQHHSPKYTKHESYKRLHGARPAGSRVTALLAGVFHPRHPLASHMSYRVKVGTEPLLRV